MARVARASGLDGLGARRSAVVISELLSRRWWAHQDSNLEQAGYEPAALTVELWARELKK